MIGHFERSRVKNNKIYNTRPKFTLRDRMFEGSRVNFLSYIEEKIWTGVSLQEIKNFERSKFEPSRVTCDTVYHVLKKTS
jgi:hypothetical protein